MIPDEVRTKLIDYAEWFEAERDACQHSCGNWDGGDPRTCDKCQWQSAYTGMVKLINSLPQPPQPDWSQAPEWAMWWAVSPWGDVLWAEREPTKDEFDTMLNGYGEFINFEYMWALEIDIPLSVDWRTLKVRRPEVTE